MSTSYSFTFTTELWEWAGKSSWFFLSLPEADADEIDERFGRTAAGFGSIRVEVRIGDTTWQTSIFPSTSEKTYILPVKKAVRSAEGLAPGVQARVELSIIED